MFSFTFIYSFRLIVCVFCVLLFFLWLVNVLVLPFPPTLRLSWFFCYTLSISLVFSSPSPCFYFRSFASLFCVLLLSLCLSFIWFGEVMFTFVVFLAYFLHFLYHWILSVKSSYCYWFIIFLLSCIVLTFQSHCFHSLFFAFLSQVFHFCQLSQVFSYSFRLFLIVFFTD